MAKQTSKPKRVPEADVQEVQEFYEAQQRLDQFRAHHEDIFSEFDQIAANYNQKLEAADKTCRALNISCGPFDLYQTGKTYDAKALFDSLGREQFIQVGGKISTQTIYDVDKPRVEASIDQGIIPTDVVSRFRKVTPRYHKPGKIELP